MGKSLRQANASAVKKSGSEVSAFRATALATLFFYSFQAVGAPLASTANIVPITEGLQTQRYSLTKTLDQATAAFVVNTIRVTASGPANITLRIGMPQLELSAVATNVISTGRAEV